MGDRGTEDRGTEELRHKGIEGWRGRGLEDLYVVREFVIVMILCVSTRMYFNVSSKCL